MDVKFGFLIIDFNFVGYFVFCLLLGGDDCVVEFVFDELFYVG